MWDDIVAFLKGYAVAVTMAALGRALVAAVQRPAISWALLWEIPVVLAMGAIGVGVAEWLGLQGHVSGALVALLAYFGPSRLPGLIALVLRKERL